MSSCLHFLITVFTTTILLALVQADCYFPDRSLDTDGYVCNTTAGAVTHCCRTFEACMDRGVCYTQWDSQFYRRSCTDQDWGEGCPTVCTDADRSGPNGILACSQGTNPTYCCGNGSETCCSPSTTFEFIPGDFLGVLDAQGNLAPPLPPSTTITRTTTANGGSGTATAGFASTDSSSSAALSTTSDASAGAAATETSSPSSTSRDSSKSRTIGLAVGIPLGVLLIASIGGLFWYFNRKLNQEKEERRKLEERLMSSSDPSKQQLAEKNRYEKDVGGSHGEKLPAEIESAGPKYEMPVGNTTAYEFGSNASTAR